MDSEFSPDNREEVLTPQIVSEENNNSTVINLTANVASESVSDAVPAQEKEPKALEDVAKHYIVEHVNPETGRKSHRLSYQGREAAKAQFQLCLDENGVLDTNKLHVLIEGLKQSTPETESLKQYNSLLIKSLEKRIQRYDEEGARLLMRSTWKDKTDKDGNIIESKFLTSWGGVVEQVHMLPEYKDLPVEFVEEMLFSAGKEVYKAVERYCPKSGPTSEDGTDELYEQMMMNMVSYNLSHHVKSFIANRDKYPSSISPIDYIKSLAAPNKNGISVIDKVTMGARIWVSSPLPYTGMMEAYQGKLTPDMYNNIIKSLNSKEDLTTALQMVMEDQGLSRIEVIDVLLNEPYVNNKEELLKEKSRLTWEKGYEKRGLIGKILEKGKNLSTKYLGRETFVSSWFEKYVGWKADDAAQNKFKMQLIHVARLAGIALSLGSPVLLDVLDEYRDDASNLLQNLASRIDVHQDNHDPSRETEFSHMPLLDYLNIHSHESVNIPLDDVEFDQDLNAEGHAETTDIGNTMEDVQALNPDHSYIPESINLGLYSIDADSQEYKDALALEGHLQQDLDHVLENAPGEWGVYIKNLQTGEEFSYNQDQVFHPASTIKIPIAVAVLDTAEHSGIDLETFLNSRPLEQDRTVDQLMEAMLINSEEDATEILSQFVNGNTEGGMDSYFSSSGYDISVYPRHTTSHELGRLLEDLSEGKILEQPSQEYVFNLLQQESKDDFSRIGASLPAEIRADMAHKIGTILGDDGPLYIVSDAGVVTLPNGDKYVISVISDFTNESGSYNDVVATVQNISGLAIEAFNPDTAIERLQPTDASVIHIPEKYANVGRLNNLLTAAQYLDGYVLQPGETLDFNQVVHLSTLNPEYMKGYAYGTPDSTAQGGGICGIVSALATEANRVGIEYDSTARHLPTDHAEGGLYYNLLNASTSTSKPFAIVNSSDKPMVVNISTNFDSTVIEDFDNDDWDVNLDPNTSIGQDEFQVMVKLDFENSVETASYSASENNLATNIEVQNNMVSETVYQYNEYSRVVERNMDIAVEKINEYFSNGALSTENDHFSYLEVMDHFADEEWTYTTSLRGAGACDIATLMYRSLIEWGENTGHEFEKIGRDSYGHEIFSNGIVEIRKIDHSEYTGKPADEIAVVSVSPTNPWNSDFEIKIVDDSASASDLNISFQINKDAEGNYIAQIVSNLNPNAVTMSSSEMVINPGGL